VWQTSKVSMIVIVESGGQTCAATAACHLPAGSSSRWQQAPKTQRSNMRYQVSFDTTRSLLIR